MNHFSRRPMRQLAAVLMFPLLLIPSRSSADGFVKGPAKYRGSLEERSQEAIIIFQESRSGGAIEDMILKINVEGETDKFAWVIPFPNKPDVTKSETKLFEELYGYVEHRRKQRKAVKGLKFGGLGAMGGGVEVLSREVVGSYDVAVVSEKTPGTLSGWLEHEGYQPITDSDDVIGFYRDKGYVFACIKITDANLKAGRPVDIHPLHFTFRTGGRDGIYFPMRMTGLQKNRFDVNLYVFFKSWLNDALNQYGYEHKGFTLKYRDWDGPSCVPDAGKNWANPGLDPFLRNAADRIVSVAGFFGNRYPDKRFYLTNIQARNLDPAEVRQWRDDLWLFPYYTKKNYVPLDARPGSPAADGYAKESR